MLISSLFVVLLGGEVARFRAFVVCTCHQRGEGGDSVKRNSGFGNIDTECGETQATITVVCVQHSIFVMLGVKRCNSYAKSVCHNNECYMIVLRFV